MTEQKPPENAGLDAEIEQVRRTMTYLTELLALMEDEVMEGDPSTIKEAAKLLIEIRNWSRLAMETEARFEEREKRRSRWPVVGCDWPVRRWSRGECD